MADFAAARLQMVDNQLRTSTVNDHRVLAAMGAVPREAYLPPGRAALAYADVVHALGDGRYLAAPAPFAKLIQLAEIEHSDHVLDVGAGTGYSSAVLARLAVEVTALEADAGLAEQAKSNLAKEGVTNARVIVGSFDGAGLPRHHFDVIVVEGAVSDEPTLLFELLREGGRLVVLIEDDGPGVAHIFVRSGDEVAGRSEFNGSMPRLPVAVPSDTFVF